jgi:DNA-binding NtrC family response regulator
VDLILLDIRLPGADGIQVLERIKALDDGVEVILVTAVRTVRTAVAAMKLGAFDFLSNPSGSASRAWCHGSSNASTASWSACWSWRDPPR